MFVHSVADNLLTSHRDVSSLALAESAAPADRDTKDTSDGRHPNGSSSATQGRAAALTRDADDEDGHSPSASSHEEATVRSPGDGGGGGGGEVGSLEEAITDAAVIEAALRRASGDSSEPGHTLGVLGLREDLTGTALVCPSPRSLCHLPPDCPHACASASASAFLCSCAPGQLAAPSSAGVYAPGMRVLLRLCAPQAFETLHSSFGSCPTLCIW